jgi:hypothetical protein
VPRLAFTNRLILAALAFALLGGCADGHNRHEITGEVKLKGEPVEQGIIQFDPLDGQPTGDGATIIKGSYKIPRDKGLAPGKYKVSIYAGNGFSGEGDASPDSPFAGKRIANKERVPPEYNERTKLVKEVTQGGPNRFDFEIP